MSVDVEVDFHLLKVLFDTLPRSCVAMFAWLLAQTVLTSEDAVVCVFGFGVRVFVVSLCDGGEYVVQLSWMGYWWLWTLSLRNARWTLQTVSGALPATRFCGVLFLGPGIAVLKEWLVFVGSFVVFVERSCLHV